MTRITLIRHGEPSREFVGTHYGDADIGLSPLGESQSHAVANRLVDEAFDAIWSSDLERAKFLARRLAATRGLEVQVERDLRERAVGIFQGLQWGEAEAAYPDVARQLRNDPVHHELPGGGENLTHLAARVLPAIDRIRAAHSGHHVALAAHAGPIRVILGHVLGLPLENVERIKLDYCGVSTIEFRGAGAVRALRINA